MPVARNRFYLGNQLFYAQNQISFDPASDFAQGIKTGPVDYDQRLHSFFIAVDDHSGGMGYDIVNVREEIGLWSHSILGVDARRNKHLHAPPHILRAYSTTSSLQVFQPELNCIPSPLSTLQIGNNVCWFWPGRAFYTTDGYAVTSASLASATNGKLLRCFMGDNSGTSSFYALYREGTSIAATVRAWRSTNGTSWTAQSQRSLWDVYYFQGHFWALGDDGIQLSTAYPAGAGGSGLPPGIGQFIGPYNTPAGDPGMYFIKAGRLFYAIRFRNFLFNDAPATYEINGIVYDTGIVTPAVIELQSESFIAPGFIIQSGMLYKNSLILTDGYNVIQYTVAGAQEIIRDIGFQEFRFAVPQIVGGMIRAWTADDDGIWVAVQNETLIHICHYNDKGWSYLGQIPDPGYVQSMGINYIPTQAWPTTKKSLYIQANAGSNASSTEISRPTGNGAYTAWTGDFQDVDEVSADDATTLISTPSVATTRESYTHGGITPGGLSIQKVILHYRARKLSGSGDTDVRPFLRIGSTDYEGSTQELSSSWVNYERTWSTNPATGGAWTEAAIDALELGIRTVADTGSAETAQVTQMYLETFYYSPNMTVYEMWLPAGAPNIKSLASESIAPGFGGLGGGDPIIGQDHFARTWDIYTGWLDGGFIDLQGKLFQFLADGRFTPTAYVEVYYEIDNGIEGEHEGDGEHLLGTITGNNQTLYWGQLHAEGEPFYRFRLHFKGISGSPDPSNTSTELKDVDQALGDNSARTKLAQSFIVDNDDTLHGVLLYLQKVSTPTDNITITIEADDTNKPDGIPLASSSAQAGAMIETAYGWRYFTFSSPPSLTAGVKYWLVVQRSGAVDAAKYYQFGADASSPTYTNGEAKTWNGTDTWSALNSDLIFQVVTDKRQTADMQGYVIAYNKRPKYRAQCQVVLDIEGMIAEGVLIDGQPPTFKRVYNKLVELWDNPTLLDYRVPGVRNGHCEIAAMPIVVSNVALDDDNEDDINVVVDGNITLQLLETLTGPA
jgi:hypothetical protein